MILSILIPTIPERAHLYKRTIDLLGYYDNTQVQIIPKETPKQVNGGPTTGRKRNELINEAQGEYIVFVDDDDFPQPNYINDILEALKSNPDCVTFNGWYTENGGPRINFVIKLGEKYEARMGKVYRWPNHLCPMKKRIAQSVRFPDRTTGEDYEWSKQIADRGLIKTSVHIEKDLYYYDYRSNK